MGLPLRGGLGLGYSKSVSAQPDIDQTFTLREGDTVILESTHGCDVEFLDELESARRERTGVTDPWEHHRTPVKRRASHDGKWRLIVNFFAIDEEDEQTPPRYTISVSADPKPLTML